MQFKQIVRRAGLVAGGALVSASAFAATEVPAEVTGALSDAKAMGIAIGAAVLVVIIAIAAFKFIRRAV